MTPVWTIEREERPTIRLRILLVPAERSRYLAIAESFIFVTLAFLVNLVAVGLPLALVLQPLAPAAGLILMLVVSVTGMPTVALAIRWLAKRRKRRALRSTPDRSRRLAGLANTEAAQKRLPHRLIEHALRERQPLAPHLANLRSGDILVVVARDEEPFYLPGPTAVSFEPISLTEWSEQVAWYHSVVVEAIGGSSVDAQVEEEETRSRALWEKLGPLGTCIVTIGMAVLSAAFFIKITALPLRGDALVVGLVLFLLGGGPIARLFFCEDRFLVPGGVVLRKDIAWRRRQEISLLTPDRASLLLDFGGGTTMIRQGGILRKFDTPEYARWALLAGWLSTARTPTLDEVKTFLGAEESGDPPEVRAG